MNDSDPAIMSDEPGLDMGLPPAPVAAQVPAAAASQPYRVLARAYRPQRFSELIGQDAMVQTLANAIRRDRLAHAFLMTGVRGVGKTSTARLIAKALNCIGPDGDGGPTIDPCGVCEQCKAITEGRHIDVIEMDAASHTGVDDVREIIEAVRYASVSARYKVYIIDEVHMLSKNAFNALLKTLEEPPGHVKFLFATTEVNKVPVTVLSRCQRFDLRRITPDMLFAHFKGILEKEGVAAEDEAIRLIATAAEGSVRDGLSLLDQAIAHSAMEAGEGINAGAVRAMLGLSDQAAILRLFDALLNGDAGGLIDHLRAYYALGAEPTSLIEGAMQITHALTLAKQSRQADPLLAAEAREYVEQTAPRLGLATLHRIWQLLLKGHREVIDAPRRLEACEMALLRVLHAAQMPDPGALAALLAGASAPASAAASTGTMPGGTALAPMRAVPGSVAAPPAASGDAPSSAALPGAGDDNADQADQSDTGGGGTDGATQQHAPLTLASIEALLEQGGHLHLARQLRDHVRPTALGEGELRFAATGTLPGGFAGDLAKALRAVTGRFWAVHSDEGVATASIAPSLIELEAAAQQAELDAVRSHPLVAAALEIFPDAEITQSDAGNARLH